MTERGGGAPRAQGSVPVPGDGPLEIEQRELVTAAAVDCRGGAMDAIDSDEEQQQRRQQCCIHFTCDTLRSRVSLHSYEN